MTDSPQQAREILDRLTSIEFDLCLEIDRNFNELPRAPGIYEIRHRTDGLLYLGKTNDLSTRFNGGHKAFTWAWLDLYIPSDVRIAIERLDRWGKTRVIIRDRSNPTQSYRTAL